MQKITQSLFPRFAELVDKFEPEQILPPASLNDLKAIEHEIGIPLPESYKKLLQCTRGFWLMGGAIQFGSEHPFVHSFEPYEQLSPTQQKIVKQKSGKWPPPSDGMLCFAEFCMESDGDQVLFDTRNGLIDGEYPVVYYAHDARPPKIRILSSSFSQFMNEFLDYGEFSGE